MIIGLTDRQILRNIVSVMQEYAEKEDIIIITGWLRTCFEMARRGKCVVPL